MLSEHGAKKEALVQVQYGQPAQANDYRERRVNLGLRLGRAMAMAAAMTIMREELETKYHPIG